jgi:hypothetical protein
VNTNDVEETAHPVEEKELNEDILDIVNRAQNVTGKSSDRVI